MKDDCNNNTLKHCIVFSYCSSFSDKITEKRVWFLYLYLHIYVSIKEIQSR